MPEFEIENSRIIVFGLLSWIERLVTVEGKKSWPVNMSELNGHISVTENRALISFGVSTFGSYWLIMNGMS